MTYLEMARIWKKKGGRQWWIITRHALRERQKELTTCKVVNDSNPR